MDEISLAVAFSAGVLSFLSPCVLAMVPVYLASLYGPGIYEPGAARARLPLFLHSLSFVVGFTLIFVALGALAGLTGYGVRLSTGALDRIAGVLLIAFGVFMLAALKVPWLNFEKRLNRSVAGTTGYLRSLLIGAVFSAGWTACTGPVLGGILMLASVRATAGQGAFLLAVYSLGLGLPFLILGVALDSALPLLKRVRRFGTIISAASGALLILVGILVLTGNLARFFSFGI